jgi:HEAT repeat protein
MRQFLVIAVALGSGSFVTGHLLARQDPSALYAEPKPFGPEGPYSKTAIPILIDALNKSWRQPNVAHALADHGSEAVPALVRALARTEPTVREGAILALSYVDPKPIEAIPKLVGALKDPEPNVRAAAARAIGRIGTEMPGVAQQLIPSLHDKVPEVREAAAESLCWMHCKDAIPVLISLLRDEGFHVRAAAAKALGRQGPGAKEAVPGLISALHDEPYICGRAALALGAIGPDAREAVPALIEIAKKCKGENSLYATDALGKIGPDSAPAVQVLTEALKNDVACIPVQAATALGRIGSRAKSALPALSKAIHRAENSVFGRDVVEAMIGAVEKIDPQYALSHGLTESSVLIRSGEVPKIKAGHRRKTAAVDKNGIESLIKELANIGEPQDVSTSSLLYGHSFAPLPDRQDDSGTKLTRSWVAFTNLVEIGPAAIPFLLQGLENKTPTKMRLHHDFTMGGMCFSAELPGNPVNRAEKPFVSERDDCCSWFEESETPEAYTVKVGDVCFVVLGQIVGRKYLAVRPQPTAFIFLNSPVRDKNLRGRILSIWSSQDPNLRLLDSLLQDLYTEGDFNGKPLLLQWAAYQFQCDAMRRLLYYFPTEACDLVASHLHKVHLKDKFSKDEFLKSVSWCKEPKIQRVVARMCWDSVSVLP